MTSDPAAAYGLFTGRFSEALAPRFLAAAAPEPGQRVLDVGCGPGALTRLLVERLGASSVAAVAPSAAYVTAVRAGLPGIDARRAPAESLPYPDGGFDAALAQLVVHFLADPVAGLREMARVTRSGGAVAACVWDNAGGRGPLSPLWRTAREVDPDARDESGAPGARAGDLERLARQAGLVRVRPSEFTVAVPFATFDEWWSPLELGVGSGGAYVQRLGPARRRDLRDRLERVLGRGPFTAEASAWCVRAEVPDGP
jgi:SAM-dependent methyltransferase